MNCSQHIPESRGALRNPLGGAPRRLHTNTHPPKRLAHPRSPMPPLSSLTTCAYHTDTHARPLHPEALASVPYGIVLRRSSSSSSTSPSRIKSCHEGGRAHSPLPSSPPSPLSSPPAPPFAGLVMAGRERASRERPRANCRPWCHLGLLGPRLASFVLSAHPFTPPGMFSVHRHKHILEAGASSLFLQGSAILAP